MGEAHEIQLQIIGDETREVNSHDENNQQRNYKWWLLMVIFTVFLIAGQSIATLLGRLYFDKGGNSKWLATLVQTIGFPLLLPLYFLSKRKNHANHHPNPNPPSILVLGTVYISIGILLAADCLLYSLGLLYLPVSTYSLICATQLAFNAFFAFFLNSQKLTPLIINSLFLLTISSILLVFQSDSGNNNRGSTKGQKYAIGFICTLLASVEILWMLSIVDFVASGFLSRSRL